MRWMNAKLLKECQITYVSHSRQFTNPPRDKELPGFKVRIIGGFVRSPLLN